MLQVISTVTEKSSPDLHLLCFYISRKSLISCSGLWKGLLPYENYFEEVRRHHVVFLEYTLQNFLLLQSNSLNKITKESPIHFDHFQKQELVTTNCRCNILTGFQFTSLNESLTICF